MVSWCGEGHIDFNEQGPTTCFSYSFILPIPSIFFLIYACIRGFHFWDMLPFSKVDDKTIKFLKIMQLMCFAQAILTIAFSTIEDFSGALLFSTIIQAAAWCVCVTVLEKEAWRLPVWPGKGTLLYLAIQLIVTLVFSSTEYASDEKSTTNLLACVLLFILNVSIFLMGIFKDALFRSEGEYARLEQMQHKNSKRKVDAYKTSSFFTGSDADNLSNDSNSANISLSTFYEICSYVKKSFSYKSGSDNDGREPLMLSRDDEGVYGWDDDEESLCMSARSSNASSWFSREGMSEASKALRYEDEDDEEEEESSEDDDSVDGVASRNNSTRKSNDKTTFKVLRGNQGDFNKRSNSNSSGSMVRSVLDAHLSSDNLLANTKDMPILVTDAGRSKSVNNDPEGRSRNTSKSSTTSSLFLSPQDTEGKNLEPPATSNVLQRAVMKKKLQQNGYTKSQVVMTMNDSSSRGGNNGSGNFGSRSTGGGSGVIPSVAPPRGGGFGTKVDSMGSLSNVHGYGGSGGEECHVGSVLSYIVSVNNWGLRRNRTLSTIPKDSEGRSAEGGSNNQNENESLGRSRGGGRESGSENSDSEDSDGEGGGAVRERSYGFIGSGRFTSPNDVDNNNDDDNHNKEDRSGAMTFSSFRSRFLGGIGGVKQRARSGSNNSTDDNLAVSINYNEDNQLNDEGVKYEDEGGNNREDRDSRNSINSNGKNSTTRLSLVRGGNNSKSNIADSSSMGLSPFAAPSTSKSIGNNTTNNTVTDVDCCEVMQREFGEGAEIEFEICLRSGGGGSKVANIWQSQNESKWSVWKTAKEINNLHSFVLSTFGDAAPRRPKLKTTPEQNRSMSGNSTIIPHASIVSDMRNITAYLTGLLQHHRHLRCTELYEFLEFDVNSATTSQNTKGAVSGRMNVATGSYSEEEEENGSLVNTPKYTASTPMSHTPRVGASSNRSAFDFCDEDINNNPLDSNGQSTQVGAGNNGGIDSSISSGVVTNANTLAARKERWRKLFVQMRMHLKPAAIAIRCRLYEGVLTGSDICKWLVQCKYKFAQDSAQACVIGQELLSCGLLIPVSCGNVLDDEGEEEEGGRGNGSGGGEHDEGEEDDEEGEEDEEDDDEGNKNDNNRRNRGGSDLANKKSTPNPVTDSCEPVYLLPGNPIALQFSTGTGYFYRYPSKSGTGDGIGTFTLFGTLVTVTIPQWAKRQQRGENRKKNFMDQTTIETKLEASTGGQGFIHYEVVVSHHNDEWSVWRRYSDFECYHKKLVKLGIKPSMGLPSKRFNVNTFGQSVNTQIETRRASLEAYIIAAVEAVMIQNASAASTSMDSPVAMNAREAILSTALFFDDEYYKLQIVQQPSIKHSDNGNADAGTVSVEEGGDVYLHQDADALSSNFDE